MTLKLAPDVTLLETVTCLDLDAERVLTGAAGQLAHVVLVGTGHDGAFYFASNKTDGPECLWLLEMAKLRLLQVTDQA